MRTGKIKLAAEFAGIFRNFLAAFAVIILVNSIIEPDKVSISGTGLLLIIPLLYWLFRHKITTFFLFVLLHAAAAMAGTVLLASTTVERVVYGMYAVLAMVCSLGGRVREGREPVRLPPVLYILVFAVCYISGGKLPDGAQAGMVQIVSTSCAVLYIIFYLAGNYLEHFYQFVEINRHGAMRIPVHRIFGLGSVQTLAFTGLTLGAAFLLSSFNLEFIISFLKDRLFMLLRFLFSKIPTNKDAELPPVTPAPVSSYFEELRGADAPVPPWLQKMGDLLYRFLCAAVIIIIIAGAVYVVYGIYRRFYEKKDTVVDKREFLRPLDKKEKRKRNGEKKEARGPVFWFRVRNNNERVRKAFYVTITGRMKKDQAYYSASTPSEFTGLFDEREEKEQMHHLADCYGKARYSSESCSDEEVKKVKEIQKQLN